MQTTVERQAVTIDLEDFVNSAFDGSNEFVNVGAAPDRDTAERLILAAIEQRIGRRLTAHEAGNGVGMEVGLAWNRRAQMRRAQLQQTRRALHNPMFGLGR